MPLGGCPPISWRRGRPNASPNDSAPEAGSAFQPAPHAWHQSAVTRTHRFLGGLSLGYFYLGLVTVVGLWLTPFLLGRIGTHDYGLWLITSQILGYLMLLDLGVVALVPRETAYATGRALDGASPTISRAPLPASAG